MNVPKPFRFEVDAKIVLKVLNVLYTYYLHRLFACISYTEIRTIIIPQLSLPKRLVNWWLDREIVWSRWRHIPHHLQVEPKKRTTDAASPFLLSKLFDSHAHYLFIFCFYFIISQLTNTNLNTLFFKTKVDPSSLNYCILSRLWRTNVVHANALSYVIHLIKGSQKARIKHFDMRPYNTVLLTVYAWAYAPLNPPRC